MTASETYDDEAHQYNTEHIFSLVTTELIGSSRQIDLGNNDSNAPGKRQLHDNGLQN